VTYQPSIIEQRVEWTRFRRQTDKDVLKALARWWAWRSDGTHVRPSSVDALAAKSGIPKRSVTRALRRLIDEGWLQVETSRHRQTTTYRIVLDRLAAEDAEHAALVVDHTTPLSARVALKTKLERQSGAQDKSGAQGIRPDLNKVALPYRSEEEVGEEICPSTTSTVRERQSGAQDAAVVTFATWWTATYPQHNKGALNAIDATHDGAVIRELLVDYPLDRLQAMTLQLWQLIADGNAQSDQSWIARTNRGLRVLRRKAAFLDLTLRAPQQLTFGPMGERHPPAGGIPAESVIDRLLPKFQKTLERQKSYGRFR